jgi:hypothetical protein
MSWTTPDVVPGSVIWQAPLTYSKSAGSLVNNNQLAVSAKDWGGAVFDPTGVTGFTLIFDNGNLPGPWYKSVSTSTGTLGNNTSTAWVTLSPSQQDAIFSQLYQGGISSGNLTVIMTDGTNPIIIATAPWSINVVP